MAPLRAKTKRLPDDAVLFLEGRVGRRGFDEADQVGAAQSLRRSPVNGLKQ